MYLKLEKSDSVIIPNLVNNCPSCSKDGTFKTEGGMKILPLGNILGLHVCPNPNCKGLLIAIYDKNNKLIKTYPGSRIAINTENVPQRITDAFKEAVECYSNNCFVASAIMIRKTLEEICIDKDATGDNLYRKIQNISSQVLIPSELLEAMNDLRLLGNDAAHFESVTYNTIGIEEIKISIMFVQEIIKTLYQYDSLLTKLRSLKKKTTD